MANLKAQLHSAEHVFWALLKGIYPSIKTEAMEFKPNKLRLDYRCARKIDKEKIKNLEKSVNETIKKNLPVKIEIMPREKAAKIADLSLLPKTVKNIRIVKIGDLSTEACAGEHVQNTSEIGKFKILEVKKSGKSKLRVYVTVEEKMKTKKQILQAKAKIKPQTLKGFRDFLPEEMVIRQKVIDILRNVFESYGYEPLETPSLEYASTLLGKYGEEADRLVYTFKDKGNRDVGLIYDLTVPASKVLALYSQKIPLPLRRYQIQRIWRAEKPQRGRYREVLQCDLDIFGSSSPLADAEIVAIIYECLKGLKFEKFTIKINSRQVLLKLMENAKVPKEKVLPAIRIVDKLDKVGQDKVEDEIGRLLDKETAKEILTLINQTNPDDYLAQVFKALQLIKVPKQYWKFDPTLARGLDYYTGPVFETYVEKPKIGSITGGGRYDKLISDLGGPDIPATGTTIGLDRICDVIKEQNLWPDIKPTKTQVLITIFSPEYLDKSIEVATTLRFSNLVNTELYPDPEAKLDKQLKCADKKGIPYVIILGPEEAKKDSVTIKNMASGKQETISSKALEVYFNQLK